MRQAKVYVKGDVIGVGFRAWTKIQSIALGVNGWVKNNFDRADIFGPQGGVEALLQADEDNLTEMITRLRLGSPVSRVDDIEVIFEDVKDTLTSFEIVK